MINKKDLKGFIISNLNSEHFLIDLSVSSSNQIQVFIDSMEGLPIIECVKYTKLIEEEFDRDVEDYELSVSSGGLDLSFTVSKQYEKYLNTEVEAVTVDGLKESGILLSHSDDAFILEVEKKEAVDGKKRKELVKKELEFVKAEIKSVKPVFSFKKNKKK